MSKGSIQPRWEESQGDTEPTIWSVCFVAGMILGTLQTSGLLSSSLKPHEIIFTITWTKKKDQIVRTLNQEPMEFRAGSH